MWRITNQIRMCLFWLAAASTLISTEALADPPVTVLSNPPADVREFFKNEGFAPVDTIAFPDYAKLETDVVNLTKKLLIPADGPDPIRIVLIDSLHPNAFFLKTGSGERVLGVHIGLLRMLETDDELAFVIGHELEHGVSKLADHIENRRSRNDIGAIEIFGLRRAVENEVDVQSVLRRIHEKNFNPNGSIHFIDRMIQLYGDSMIYSHSLFQSRRDTVSLALTAVRRGLGQKVKADKESEYQTELVHGAQKNAFSEPRFKNMQMQRLEKLIADSKNPFSETFEQLKNGTLENYSLYNIFQSAHDDLTIKTIHLTKGLITEKERLDVELRLYEVLDQQFESAKTKILGNDLSSLSHEQLQQLQKLYERRYLLSISRRNSGGLPDVIPAVQKAQQLGQSLRQKEREVRFAKPGEEKSEATAGYDKLKKKRDEAAREAELELHTYDPSAPALIARYERVSNAYQQADGKDKALGAQLEALSREIKLLRRVIGPIRKRSDETTAALFDLGFEELLKGAKNLGELSNAIERMGAQSPERIDRDPLRILEAYIEVTKRELAEGGWGWGGPLQTWLSYNNDGTMGLLNKARKKDPKRVEDFFGKWVDVVMDAAPTARQLAHVFAGAHRPKRTDEPLFIHGDSSEGLYFSRPLANAVWTKARLTHFLNRMDQLFQADVARYLTGSRDDVFQDFFENLEAVTDKVQYLRKNGFLNPALEERLNVSEKLRRTFDTAANFLIEHSRLPGAPVLSTDQAKCLILARLPEYRDVLDPTGNFSNQKIISEAASVASLPELAEKLSGVLSYFRIPQLFKGEKPERMFEFLFSSQKLINFNSSGDWEYQRDDNKPTDEIFDIGMRASEWAKKAHPEDGRFCFAVLNPHLRELGNDRSTLRDRFGEQSKRFFKERFEFWRLKYAGLSYDEQTRRASESLWKEVTWTVGSGRGDNMEIVDDAIASLAPANPRQRLRFYNAYIEGLSSALALESQAESILNYSVERRTDMDGFVEVAKGISQMPGTDPDLLRRTHENLTKYKEVSPLTDALFEQMWTMRDGNSQLAQWLAATELIQNIYYDENRKKCALWQLEREFSIKSTSQKLKAGTEPLAVKGSVRLNLARIKDFINRQFEKKSAVKNEVLSSIEKNLLCNADEVKFLEDAKITVNNWYESRRLAAVDLPQQLSKSLDRYQQYQFLLYLIGASEKVPKLDRHAIGLLPKEFADEIEIAQAARRHFFEADIFTRTYALQPLLDEKNGPLQDPHLMDRMFETVLGEHGADKIYREVIKAYFDALPLGEKKALLAYVFSSMADSPGKPVSVKRVLEGMGVFGIKAGQFLRTSGLASPALRKELDDFFDKALEPQRAEIFRRLSQVFGEGFHPIQYVRELAGSGSVNYVVIADIVTHDGKSRRVVLRIRRDGAEGQVSNENEIWIKALASLGASPTTEVRRLASVLEEARSHAMQTLQPGGAEMDLSIERRAYAEAKEAYARGQTGGNIFSIDVAQPVDDLQRLVPEPYQKLISIYEAVDHVSLSEIQDEKLRARAAFEIGQAELEALFERGVFCPDGHPGNWLIDLKNMRLVRIDYAQLRRPPPEELDALKHILGEMISPKLDTQARQKLAKQIPRIVNIPVTDPRVDSLIDKSLTDPSLPDFKHPHERLFFVRDYIERELMAEHGVVTVSFKDSARSAVSSISKTQIYAEQMGQNTYLNLLLRNLDRNPTGYKAAVLGQLVRDQVREAASRTLTTIKDICRRVLESMAPPKRKE
jgi:hypothetical protein